MNQAARRILLLLSLGLAGATVRADTDTWVANTGNWNTAGDWSAGSVPSASSGVEIGNGTGGIVSVNAVVAMNNSLKIDSGYELADYTSFFIDSLFVGGVLQPASVLNNGAIVIGPTAYPITSEFSINDVTMDGTGSFDNEGAFEVERDSIANLNGAVAQHVGDVLTGGIWFFEGGPGTILVDGTATPHVFLPTINMSGADIQTNQATVTVEGAFSFPQFNAVNNNQGTIEMEAGASFTTEGDFSNTGVLWAADGGSITVSGTLAQNQNGVLTSGTYHAGDASILNLGSGSIQTNATTLILGPGGKITNLSGMSANSGSITLVSDDHYIAQSNTSTSLTITGPSFDNSGTLNVQEGTLSLSGTLINTGKVTVGTFDSSIGNNAAYASVIVSGSVELRGGGEVQLAPWGGYIESDPSSSNPSMDVLVNVDNTITGSAGGIGFGSLGPSMMTFVNESIVETGSGTLGIGGGGPVVNSGTFLSTSGGRLIVGGYIDTPFTNTGGLVEAQNGLVEISSVIASGGTYLADGGVVFFDSEATVQDACVSLVNGGDLQFGYFGGTPDATLHRVTVTSDGSAGTGVWVNGSGGNGPTVFDNVSFLNGVAVNLVTANVLVTGTLTNTGAINFDDPNNPSGQPSYMAISGQVVLQGGGTVNLYSYPGGAPAQYSQIDGNPGDAAGTAVLVNVDNTITGSGVIGGVGVFGAQTGLLQITNEGVIEAGANESLTLAPDPQGGLINTGTISATGGGYLLILGGGNGVTAENAGGLIIANGAGSSSPSTVEVSGLLLNDGQLTAADGGEILVTNNAFIESATISLTGSGSTLEVGNATGTPDSTLHNVTVTSDGSAGQEVDINGNGFGNPTHIGTIDFANQVAVNIYGANVYLSEAITNTGTMTAQGSTLSVQESVPLEGGGTVVLDNTQITEVPGTESPADLINVDNTITGSGIIGDWFGGALKLTNEGTILADGTDRLFIVADPVGGVVNTGSVEATNGGYIGFGFSQEYSFPIENTGGSIVADGSSSGLSQASFFLVPNKHGSLVELYNTDVTGGNLTASDGGVIGIDGNTSLENVAVNLSGNYSEVSISLSGSSEGVLNNVTFTGDGSPVEQGIWAFGYGTPTAPYTSWNNVSFMGGIAVNLVGGNVLLTGTLTNTGSFNFDDPNNPTGLSTSIAISGQVRFQGGGTVNLYPQSQIDGSGGGGVLINVDNTITGSGVIGGTPVVTDTSVSYTSALQFINRGTVLATSSNSLTMVAGPIIPGGATPAIQNEGNIQVNAGGLMNVVGNYSQSSTGDIGLQLGGESPVSINNLGSANSYSHLDVSGTASLNGTFQVSLTNGFAPQLGDVFTVLNYGAYNGQFTNYLGLRLSSNLVLQPSFTNNALTLTASTVSPGTTAPLQTVAPNASLPVASGSTYAGIISTSTLSTHNNTVATVLAGTATSSTAVSISFQPAGDFAASNGGPLISDVVDFHGTGSDVFVLQIDYNEAALAAGANEADLFLAWLDPATGNWENAVLGNTGDSVPQQIIGAYDPATDFVLGDYGIDPVDGRVWAVVNHNSAFAAAAVPEPAEWVLFVFAAVAVTGEKKWPRR